MFMKARLSVVSLVVLALSCAATAASAQGMAPSAWTGYQPVVPVGAFARPAAWFDPGRLHISTSVSVGTGFSGRTDALQVTTLNYAFAAPLAMSVSLGNRLGNFSGGGSQFFLEGLALNYRPTASTFLHVEYRDYRSPLQYGYRGFGLP
jgi:hypothetical protein